MQRVVGQQQCGSLCIGEPLFHEREIAIFVTSVDFVAHDGMTKMRKVDADLMFSSCVGNHA